MDDSVSITKIPDRLYLSLLSVTPGLQTGGIGKRLLEFAETHALSLS
jgi:GNAT superfamily N-acetyltransferase